VDKSEIVYAPRAQRDIAKLQKQTALRILDDIEILRKKPWPPARVKKLVGHEYWEIKTGDFRTIFWPQDEEIVVLRIVNRRDLEKAIDRIDVKALFRWLRERDTE